MQRTFLHISFFSTTTTWNFLPTRFMEKCRMCSRSLFAKFHPGWTYAARRTYGGFCQVQNFLDAYITKFSYPWCFEARVCKSSANTQFLLLPCFLVSVVVVHRCTSTLEALPSHKPILDMRRFRWKTDDLMADARQTLREIGYFWVVPSLCYKARLSAKPWFFIVTKINSFSQGRFNT